MSVAGLKDTVTDLFSGNPFATEVGHRIEQATDPKLGAENWALFMEICDLVNENEESARDAARAIKKRLNNTVQTKEFEATLLTLTVLETCVKNCGKRFHVLICSKDYISEIVKLIGPKFEPPVILQERVLGLIQNWAETFRNSPDLHGVTEVYNELKSKGVEFPVLDLETMAPIITPQRTVAPQPQTAQTPRRPSLNTQQQQQQPQGTQHIRAQETAAMPISAGPVNMTPEQLAKLRGEVDIVKSNMQVFSEMLGEMKPGQEEPEDLQLLMDLHTTLRSMQDRVVQLLTTVSNEEVTGELLVVNDEMNALFMRYERYERQRKGASSVQSRALPQPPQQSFEPSTLIDFAAESNRSQLNGVQNQMGSMAIGRKPQPATADHDPAADFGVFAQSRVAVHSQQASTPTPTAELPQDSELEEMEHWLKSQPEQAAARVASQPSDRPTLTSAEFDRFLESRVAAAEQLPSINTNNRAANEQAPKHETSHLLDS